MLKDLLRRLRKDKGLNQIDLAQRIGVSIDSVRRWEAGKREPRLSELEKIALVLEVPITSLVSGAEAGGAENKNAPSPKEERGISNIQFDNIDYKVYVISMYDYSQLHLHGEEGLTMVTDARLTVPKFQLLEIDDKNPPFAVRQDISFNLTGRGISPADGAVVINPKYTNVESGRIYLVVYNKEILLRQVSYSPDGGYTLEADNGVHAEVSCDAVANGNFRIIGRAVMSTRGL